MIMCALFRNRYILRLANGQEWCLIATKETNSFVKKLASAMNLRVCIANEYPKMVFTRQISHEKGCMESIDVNQIIDANYPRNHWKMQDFQAVRWWSHCDVSHFFCDIGFKNGNTLDKTRMCLSVYPIYEMAQVLGGLPFHAGLIEYNGVGILLAGRGNIGKSTCCRRIPHPWRSLSDDETLIVRDTRNQYVVHPFPTWSDITSNCKQSWNTEQYLPLCGIFFLEQAKNDEVLHLGEGQAATWIYQSALQTFGHFWRNLNQKEKRPHVKRLFYNACALSKAIPSYILRISRYGRFWIEIRKEL